MKDFLPAVAIFLALLPAPGGLPGAPSGFELAAPQGGPFAPGDMVVIPIWLNLDAPAIKYVSFGIECDPGSTITHGAPVDLISLPGVSYYADQVLDSSHLSVGMGNFDFNDPSAVIPISGGRIWLGNVNLTIDPGLKVPGEVSVKVGECSCSDLDVPVPPVLHLGGEVKVRPSDARLSIYFGVPAEVPFIRGDANRDRAMDISDPLRAIDDIFLSGSMPSCPDGEDSNDDGKLDISDPVYILAYLFMGGPAPPAPFPGLGPDPTEDGLACRE